MWKFDKMTYDDESDNENIMTMRNTAILIEVAPITIDLLLLQHALLWLFL